MENEHAFSEWYSLTFRDVDEHAPAGPAAVQVRRAEGLVDYPTGKSAMVFYFFAETSARAALARVFDDELHEAGVRGHGELWFRTLEHPSAGRHMSERFDEFVARFGAPPVLHD